MTVEVLSDEAPEDRVPVVIHELAHHVFGCMPVKEQARLVDEMLRTGRNGMPAWNLFNEIQATVIGNMLAGRNVHTPERFQNMVDTPRSFYDDDAIDLGARATERVFSAALKKSSHMSVSFVKDYVTALEAGLGDMLDTPALQLRSMVLNLDDDTSEWGRKLRRAIGARSVWNISPLGGREMIEKLDRFPGLSAAVIVRADQVPQLAAASQTLGVEADALTTALGASRGVVVISERTPLALSVVFVARDDRAMDGLIAAINSCRSKPGVCLRVE